MEILRKHVNSKTVIAAAVFFCVAVAIATTVRLNSFSADEKIIDLSDMSGEMLTADDGSRYIENGSAGYVLSGGYTAFGKGNYTVEIDYRADYNASVIAYSNEYSAYLVADKIVLNSRGTHKSFNIALKDNIDDLEFRVNYSGSGWLEVSSIKVKENTIGIRTHAFIAIMLVLLLTICYLLKDKIKENKSTLFWLLVITILADVPAMAKGVITGHDGLFHLARIEGLADGLLQGDFPVRMQTNWMEGYGYPVSIYYGDLLLYIPAILRCIGFSLEDVYKAYVLLINLGTAIVTYECFKGIVKKPKIALLGTAAYMLAVYRLMDMYVRVAVGEYTAMLFLPIIALAVYKIYTDDEMEFKTYMKNAVLLAVGMAGLFVTHMLSVAMASLILVIVCVVLIKKTLRKSVLIVYISAALLTILLSLSFIVPLVDYSQNETVQMFAESEDGTPDTLQEYGAYWGQYFAIFPSVIGTAYADVADRMAQTPGILLMAFFIIGIYCSLIQKDGLVRFLTLMSALTLWFASDNFPWDFIINHVPFMNWIKTIQFTWRFLSMSQLFLSMLMCVLLAKLDEEKVKQLEPVLFSVMLVLTAQMCGSLFQGYVYWDVYNGESIDSFLASGDYIRVGTDVDTLDGKLHYNDTILIGGYTRNGKYATITGVAASESDDAWVELPILNYKNYVARDGSGNELTIVDGDNNVIRVLLPSGYVGDVTVDYEIPTIYKIADVISLLTAVGLAAWVILDKTKLKEKKQCIKRFQRT